MSKAFKNQDGFSPVDVLLVLVIAALIGVIGWSVYKQQHKASASKMAQTSKSSQPPKTPTSQQAVQKYITIADWGLRVPYTGSDTLSASAQTCDTGSGTVKFGCSVAVNSQVLADSVGSCTAKVSGTVGYFYKMGPNDNYSEPGGGGYEPITEWIADHPSQSTTIGNDYYAFAEIGKANGEVGADVASSSQYNGMYTGCDAWQSEYKAVEPMVQALVIKLEIIPQ